nr:2-amino-3,7-dideoxy-D-threo-hept-6-ulosonate synthase [Bacillus methanolicus]
MEHIGQAVQSVFKGNADAVVVHKGLVNQIVPVMDANSGELIIHLSASTNMSPDPNQKELVTSVEHAVRLGATAISVHVNIGSPTEACMLEHLGKVAEECDKWGMPLLAMMYVRDSNKVHEYNPQKIRHAARIAEELGADIVKVNYTGSLATFKEVTDAINIPVVIAGGDKVNSTEHLLYMVAEAVEAGANVLSMERNIFQHANPTKLTNMIRQELDSESPLEKAEEIIKKLG